MQMGSCGLFVVAFVQVWVCGRVWVCGWVSSYHSPVSECGRIYLPGDVSVYVISSCTSHFKHSLMCLDRSGIVAVTYAVACGGLSGTYCT